MSKVVTIITDPATGGTFLSWSLHYLAGHTTHLTSSGKYVDLPDNPVQKHNAHGFERINTDSTYKGVKSAIALLDNPERERESKNLFNVLYVHSKCYHLDKHTEWHRAFNLMLEKKYPVILVRLPKTQVLYHSLLQLRRSEQTQDTRLEYFFSNLTKQRKKLILASVYDKREFIALHFRPFDFDQYATLFNSLPDRNNILHLLSIDVWQNLDNTIHDIMKFIDIPINSKRYEKWLIVYAQWKQIHTKRIMWCWYFDTIIEYILKGYSMDLERFDLDLYQEAVIQHVLIYKYGLNLKTFELYKFTNTKQLHDLLEPTLHPFEL